MHASFALREIGYETVMVNSNPETVSTDYDTSDKLYFEPLTLEDVLNIYDQEKPEGVFVQFGGQTPLNLADGLKAAGVPILGTQPESIEMAEDRKLFAAMLDKLGLRQTPSGSAVTTDEAVSIARYLASVVGRAHGRQMDEFTRKRWQAELGRNRSKTLDAPSWLWSSVVELVATHEAAYLEHCRRYAMSADG